MPDVLVIDRAKWLRGEGTAKSFLIRSSDGKQCCLGFDLLRRGFTPANLLDLQSPCEVETLEGYIEGLVDGGEDTSECDELMRTNDDELLTEALREEAIKDLYEGIGVIVQFIN